MKPIDQTVVRSPDDHTGPPGNCFAACLASLLEVGIDEVPQPTVEDCQSEGGWSRSGGYWELIARWLHDRGLHMVEIDRDRGLREASTIGLVEGAIHFWIATGCSPRGAFLHSVVMQGGHLAHDPHPSRAGIDGDIVKASYLVALDPSKLSGAMT